MTSSTEIDGPSLSVKRVGCGTPFLCSCSLLPASSLSESESITSVNSSSSWSTLSSSVNILHNSGSSDCIFVSQSSTGSISAYKGLFLRSHAKAVFIFAGLMCCLMYELLSFRRLLRATVIKWSALLVRGRAFWILSRSVGTKTTWPFKPYWAPLCRAVIHMKGSIWLISATSMSFRLSISLILSSIPRLFTIASTGIWSWTILKWHGLHM